MAITRITRAALAQQLATCGYSWTGDLDEVGFLSGLYLLDEMPSSDPRYANARDDIVQHRVINFDWRDGWVFDDPRFELGTSDEHLLRFLAHTAHPEVRSDASACRELVDMYNKLLRHDGIELVVEQHRSGRPIFGPAPAREQPVTVKRLQDAIAEVIWRDFSANDVADYCVTLGLPGPFDQYDDPMNSKRGYVRAHTKHLGVDDLVAVADKVLADHDDPDLRALLLAAQQRGGGVSGAAKNLIFAADGPKPELVLRDAINNTIEITRHAEHCLVYDRDLRDAGLTWKELVAWWSEANPAGSELEAGRALHRRLGRSISAESPGEQVLFKAYARLYGKHGFGLPALIPQVYLHLDPRTRRTTGGPLLRQRMDFLLLLPGRRRIVVEVDGQHHYAEGGKPAPHRYAEMMREDRQLRLAGYEVYRFGAAELLAPGADVVAGEFFVALLTAHGVPVDI